MKKEIQKKKISNFPSNKRPSVETMEAKAPQEKEGMGKNPEL